MPKAPEIEGARDFEGDVYFTSTWPHDGVDFTGKRVAVIGTGSSAIQSIPLIASQAAHTTVFQRTPNSRSPLTTDRRPRTDWPHSRATEPRTANRPAGHAVACRCHPTT